MTRRLRVLIIVGLVLAVLIGTLYVVSQVILVASYDKLEQQSVRRDLSRVLDALNSDLDQLNSKVGDWANWDDAYKFAQDGNPEFLKTNINDVTFQQLKINFVIFLQSSGKLLLAKAFDLENEKEISLPKDLEQLLTDRRALDVLLQNTSLDSQLMGILLTRGAPLEIAARPILTSDGNGPIRGTLIFARFLDSAEITKLAQRTHLILVSQRFDTLQASGDFRTAAQNFSDASPLYLQHSNKNTLNGYSRVNDVFGNPALILRISVPREIRQQGLATIHLFMLIVVIIIMISAGVTVVLLNHLDVSKQEREKAERLTQEMSILAEIGKVIGSSLNIEEVYERFAAEAAKLIPFDRVAVNLRNPLENSRPVTYVSGLDIPGRRKGDSVPLNGSSFNECVVKARKGVMLQSAHGEDIITRFPTLASSVLAGIHSHISVPLISWDTVIGTLVFQSKKPNSYTEEDLRLAERIGLQIAGAIANAQMFSDRKKMEAEILALSITDQLTGLHNRRGFLSLAGQQLKLAERNKSGLLLFFADLDSLKWINDTLGHEEGDKALIEAAAVFKEASRTSDIIARLGGDEYAILAVDITEANSEIFTARVQSFIDTRNNQENRRYRLSISVGYSYYDPANPRSIDELLVSADKLMYEQKQSKKALLLQGDSLSSINPYPSMHNESRDK